MTQVADQKLYYLFAQLLEYPRPGIENLVRQVIAQIQPANPEAARLLASFQQFVEQDSLPRLEEIYTSTFDLQGICHPYVGHYLFSETYQRSWFMARLNQEYRLWGYSAGNELPDHVSVVLVFLGQRDKDEFCQTLMEEGLKPAFKKMAEEIKRSAGNPYYPLVLAISILLGEEGDAGRRNPAGYSM